MTKNVYAITEIVGTSDQSISDAIQTAITKASESLRNLDWFEVGEIRGKIQNGKASDYQVTLKIGFKYDK